MSNVVIDQGGLRRATFGLLEGRSSTTVFSLSKVMLAIAERKRPAGFEGELIYMANELRGTGGALMGTDVLPFPLFNRDLTVAAPTGGGNMVGTAVQPAVGPFGGSVAAQLGCQIVTGWKDNISFPVTTGTPPVTWLTTESTGASEHTPTIGAVSAAPHVASVVFDVSHKLLRQGISIDAYLEGILRQAGEAALDAAVFAGTGLSGQPTGLLANTTITSQSGTSFGLPERALATKTVADNVVSDTGARWCAATDVRSILEQRVEFASTDDTMWANDRMGGRPALASSRMPAGGLLYGDFREVQVLLYGAGIELAADPYTQFKPGIVTYRMLLTCDVVVPRPGALVRIPAVT